MTRASVCMATYNGRRFLKIQVRSILDQLGPDDELIIVDDASSDDTPDEVHDFADRRIRVLVNPRNLGVNGTFERAMAEASGRFILLSDQDDVWLPGRLEQMIAACQRPGVEFVATNYSLIDAEGNVVGDGLAARLKADDDHRRIRNLAGIFQGRMNYYGCAMAMTARFRDAALPFPASLECHDIWLAVIGNVCGNVAHLEQDSVAHRVHGNNASIISRPFLTKLWARTGLAKQVAIAWIRRTRFREPASDLR